MYFKDNDQVIVGEGTGLYLPSMAIVSNPSVLKSTIDQPFFCIMAVL